MKTIYVLYRRAANCDYWFVEGEYTDTIQLAEAAYNLGRMGYKMRIEREGEIA